MANTKKAPARPAVERVGFPARLTREAKDRLLALVQIREQPAYELLELGFWQLWESLPPEEREAAETIAATVARARKTRQAKERVEV